MNKDTELYIEILAEPSTQYEKSLDTLELAICNSLYYGFNHIVLNLKRIECYDIMFLNPLFELLTDLTFSGGHFIIVNPPSCFLNDYRELYPKPSIELLDSRDEVLNDKRDIMHTFLEEDESLVSVLKDEYNKRLFMHEEEHCPTTDIVTTSTPEEIKSKIEIMIPEVIDSGIGFSYYNPDKGIEICTISGEYRCKKCGKREYFLKGYPFDFCTGSNCSGAPGEWKPTKKVF
jgi:hypothetical protein